MAKQDKSTLEKLQEKFFVKVVKRPDATGSFDIRISLAGKNFINPGMEEHDGTTHTVTDEKHPIYEKGDRIPAPYCIVPAHSADKLQAVNKNYDFGEPFMPEDEVKKKLIAS
jgi:hypothetical protein